jgi:hypothetical protein
MAKDARGTVARSHDPDVPLRGEEARESLTLDRILVNNRDADPAWRWNNLVRPPRVRRDTVTAGCATVPFRESRR